MLVPSIVHLRSNVSIKLLSKINLDTASTAVASTLPLTKEEQRKSRQRIGNSHCDLMPICNSTDGGCLLTMIPSRLSFSRYCWR